MWVGSTSDAFTEKRFRGRVRFLSVFFAIGFSALILRLFFLQVVEGDDFAQVSESNRTKTIFLSAPRGNFYDEAGKKIVTNRPSWSLMYSVSGKETVSKENVMDRLEPFLEPFPKRWKKRLRRAFKSKQLVRLIEDVPSDVAFGMREMGDLLPGLRMELEFRRNYPSGVTAPQLIGYMSEIDERELKEDYWFSRKPGDFIGKMGLEKLLDARLRGEDGGMLIEVDSFGRLKRVIKELPYKKGDSVQLTLNTELQSLAQELLLKTPTGRGAVVIIDIPTGEIRVWASSPPFDPSGSLAKDVIDERLPFFDRVYKGAYPPGSIFKIVTAAAGFETGDIKPSRKIKCEGFVKLQDRRYRMKRYGCWTRHGKVDFWGAMQESCDSYFYLLSQRMGSDAIHDHALKFAMGKKIQSILPHEKKGNVPNPAWKRKRGLGGWSTGDSFNMSIGQGYVTATPLQMAQMMAILATRGEAMQPHLIKKIIDENGNTTLEARPRVLKKVELEQATWDSLLYSTQLVVRKGTGRASHIPSLNIHGKTGTAQNPHGEDHAWFVAAAGPKGETPTIAVCVFVENGGNGGSIAAPISRKMIEAALIKAEKKGAV